jgi:hypothetical protein
MLTREEVVNAYVTLLGREPESEAAISSHCSAHESATALIVSLQGSEEYRLRHKAATRPVDRVEAPRTFTRDQLIKIYHDLLRRKPGNEELIASQLTAHRTSEEFENSVRESEEFQAIQTFSKKRKIQLSEVDSEVARIHRLWEAKSEDYDRALGDFWLDIQPTAAAPESEEYMCWVMDTYAQIANRRERPVQPS